MRSLGASKLALSAISSEKLWERSGRLQQSKGELMRFSSRKGTRYLLAPTHEEEITTLVSGLVKSYKQLPLRVYQVGRKYRDERRPRAGLLRGREFTMKDLYTFDATEAAAMETYEDVMAAYRALFDELGLPYLVAEADAGSMGGSLSHEFLFPAAVGEDTVLTCSHCSYAANTEAAVRRPNPPAQLQPAPADIAVHHAITADRKTLVNTYYLRASASEVNLHRIKELVPELDPSVSHPLDLFLEHFVPLSPGPTIATAATIPTTTTAATVATTGTTTTTTTPTATTSPATATTPTPTPAAHSQIINLFDCALPYPLSGAASFSNHTDHAAANAFIADKRIPTTSINRHPATNEPLALLKPRADDRCPRCDSGHLKVACAIELGHTFHLGTRYSAVLGAVAAGSDQQWLPLQQGCHGLGVSRMLAAIADALRDHVGLNWPRVVAPFDVCVICHPEKKADGEMVYDLLASPLGRSGAGVQEGGQPMDVVFDDRDVKELMWKMKDADLIGYPVFVLLGRAWQKEGKVEVQCRRKGGLKTIVGLDELRGFVQALLAEL